MGEEGLGGPIGALDQLDDEEFKHTTSSLPFNVRAD